MNVRNVPLSELVAWAAFELQCQAHASLENYYDPPADPEELALRERRKEFHRKAVAAHAAVVRAREAGCERAALRAIVQWESPLPLKNRRLIKRWMRSMRWFYLEDMMGL